MSKTASSHLLPAKAIVHGVLAASLTIAVLKVQNSFALALRP